MQTKYTILIDCLPGGCSVFLRNDSQRIIFTKWVEDHDGGLSQLLKRNQLIEDSIIAAADLGISPDIETIQYASSNDGACIELGEVFQQDRVKGAYAQAIERLESYVLGIERSSNEPERRATRIRTGILSGSPAICLKAIRDAKQFLPLEERRKIHGLGADGYFANHGSGIFIIILTEMKAVST